jgi:transcriptional regulator with GAF, ATPase, and Fis domain
VADLALWYHCLAKEATTITTVALTSLRNAGLLPTPLSDATPHSHIGVIFFDAVSEELFDLLRDLARNRLQHVLAIALSREALAGRAWQLLHAGAADVFVWSGGDSMAHAVAARVNRWLDIDNILDSPLVKDNLVGESPIWRATLRRLVEVAKFSTAPVLLVGESGTGKELIARLIHTLDSRPDKRSLITVDCTTVMPELAGSEFFGHEKGAFTSAINAREGAFALADYGTLFLDEVGELPLRLQAELLRVVQEHTFKRVGSNNWQTTNFRLICATNRDLIVESARGRFRQDFYYRIAAWVFRVPPLRERSGDILDLTGHFIGELHQNGKPPELDESVRDYILRREYTGNVRDLKQLVTRIMTRHVGPGPITAGDLAEDERPGDEEVHKDWRDDFFENSIKRALGLGLGLKEIAGAAAETAIRLAIASEEGRGRLKRAAQRLGITERALQMHRASRTRISS